MEQNNLYEIENASSREEFLDEKMESDFIEDNASGYSLLMDLSEITPGEIEIEDEIRLGYLWKKYDKKFSQK
ncbi:MAG: hypothetical protein ACTSQS_09960 [Promethearchaeota archaeon]